MLSKGDCGKVMVRDATIKHTRCYDNQQYVMRLSAPEIAQQAVPGQFVHVRCDSSLPMRRPLSILSTYSAQGDLDILYRVVGKGTRLLSEKKSGHSLSIMGPIGRGFQLEEKKRFVLLGGGLGMPPIIFAAQQLQKRKRSKDCVVFLGSEIGFPFKVQPSIFLAPQLPASTTAGMALMEDWGVLSRLSSQYSHPGTFKGFVTELAHAYLSRIEQPEHTVLLACGPEPMLKASAQLARTFGMSAQLCLEAPMACAVGGCAGCVVPIVEQGVTHMKRVCVDGPVFLAHHVYPEVLQ